MYFKQIEEIANRLKGQTRRVQTANERLWYLPWTAPLTIRGLDQPTGDFIRPVVVIDYGDHHRVKWAAGRSDFPHLDKTYAVSPGRGKPTAWWHPSLCNGPEVILPGDPRYERGASGAWDWERWGYQPLRIRILDIRSEHLLNISEADALAEGVTCEACGFSGAYDTIDYPSMEHRSVPCDCGGPVGKYLDLWESINDRPGTRWQDNPLVWVLVFEPAIKEEQ